jgi:hypothetical protein
MDNLDKLIVEYRALQEQLRQSQKKVARLEQRLNLLPLWARAWRWVFGGTDG